MDVAGVEVRGRDRHDRGRHQRADADGGESDADEPGREAVQQQRRHREVVAELLEAVGIFRKARDARRDREEAHQSEQAEHEGIARQQRRVAADGAPAVGAEDARQRMRIEEERERRAERKGGIGTVRAGAVGAGRRQEQLR